MFATEFSSETIFSLDETAKMSSLNSPKRRKEPTALGLRLLRAFKDSKGIEDKNVIAQSLGFVSDKALYKVINGERELSFTSLQKFKIATTFSTDWLLFGEDGVNEMAKTQFQNVTSLDEVFEKRMREIVREEMEAGKPFSLQDMTNRVYFSQFGKTVREKLSEIADRLELVYKESDRELPHFIVNEIKKFRNGELSKIQEFKEVFAQSQYSTKTNVDWLLTGTGNRFDFHSKEASFSVFDFHRELKKAQENELKLESRKLETIKTEQISQNVLNNLLNILAQKGIIELENLGQIGGSPDEYKASTENIEDQDKKAA